MPTLLGGVMTNSNSGYVGVVGVLLLGGALAGCVDNGNDVGFEELPHGGPSPSDNAAVVTTASGGSGPADTSGGDSDGTTGAGGAPAETTPCGPEELGLNCESDEICRAVETFGPAQYSCEPNPCLEHNQANSCECAASLCGSEAPNCVMLEDDTVVACICVFC